jgi:hypothetical protein
MEVGKSSDPVDALIGGLKTLPLQQIKMLL